MGSLTSTAKNLVDNGIDDTVRQAMKTSDGKSVENNNRLSVGIGLCIRCDSFDYNRFVTLNTNL